MNEFVVWDKDAQCFYDGENNGINVFQLNQDGTLSFYQNCDDGCFDDYYANKFYTPFKDIGLKDINGKKIYADSSIVEFNNSKLWNKYNGIFFYNKERLCYQIKIIGSIRNNEIIPYDKYCSDFKIIDTIQENKLGFIK